MNIRLCAPPEPSISLTDLPRRALAIHRMRPDVSDAFNVAANEGRSGLYWWYYLHGFREMWLDFEEEDLKGPVNAPVDHLPARGEIPVTWLMRQFWRYGSALGNRRLDKNGNRWIAAMARLLKRGREPVSRWQQRSLIAWYFCCGLQEANLMGLVTAEQVAKLVAGARPHCDVPLVIEMAHIMAPDMHEVHPSPYGSGWRDWCATEGRQRFHILDHALIRGKLFPDVPKSKPLRVTIARGPAGVNIIGHAGGRSGVGEDVRMAARALKAAGVPFIVRDMQPSSGLAGEEICLAEHISQESPFRINLFCMAGMETITMLAGQQDLLRGRINIGFWPWELARWPDLWSHAPKVMDELWASTEFTAQAYRNSSVVPVLCMPMAVAVDKSEGLTRKDFGLPEDRFLYCFAFDGHSSFSRKNPVACIEAFRQAFPRGDEPVGLILKGMRVANSPHWRDIEMRAASDPRITLLSTSLTRGALLDLYRSIDCFASLHRSEGFGRNIAECMLLGKPVIATNYSGNVDFTRPDTAALVDMKLCQVREGEYPFGTDQLWAAPSIDHAARQMQRMFVDETWRNQLARAGQTFIGAHYAPTVVGEKFRHRIKGICHSLSFKEGV